MCDDARVFLLPGGEELQSTSLLREGDALTVHRGELEPVVTTPVQEARASGSQVRRVSLRSRFASTSALPSSTAEPESPKAAAVHHIRPKRSRRRSFAGAVASSAKPSLLEDDDEAAMDAVVQELVDGDKSPAEGGAHHRDDPQKRFKRAVQRVIFINRFKDHGGGAGDDDTLNGLDAQASSVTGIEPRHRLASAGSVVGKGRSTKRSVAGKSVDAYIKNLVDLYEYAQTRVIDDKINKEKLPWHVIHPDSMIKTSWDIMTLVLVVYFAFMVPYRIGFDIPLTSGEQLFDVMSDVIFIIDLFVSFRTAFKEDGILVYSSGRMAESYMKSWFFIDILASFPIGWFMSGAETKVNKLFRMLRLFKLFRILRLIKLFPRIMAMVETSIKLNPSLLRFARSFIILFIIWHNIGCLYYFVAREEYGGVVPCVSAADAAAGQPIGEGFCFVNHCVCRGSDDASQLQVITDTIDGWYDPRSPDLWVPHFTLANAPLSTQYWQSLFWAVEVTTGIGDDIQPKSDTEVAFTVVMAVLGLVVYSVIIGSAASALQNLDADAATRRQTLETATNFMRARKVPPFFQKIIKDYYEHMWATPRDAEEVFADLPPSLRARLSIVINRDLVDRVPILQTIPADVYIRTVRRLDRATYLPGEYVARQGQGGECMFLIDRGRVDAVLPNGKTVFMTLYPGDFFGESSMLYGTLRDASFRAVDYLDLFIMDKSTFDELSVAAMGFVNEVRRVDAERQAARLRLELQSVAPAPSTDLTKNPGAAGATPGTPANALVLVTRQFRVAPFPPHPCNQSSHLYTGRSNPASTRPRPDSSRLLVDLLKKLHLRKLRRWQSSQKQA